MKDGMKMTTGQLFSGVNGLVSAIVDSGYTDWQDYVSLEPLNQTDTAHEIYPNTNAVK